MTQNNTILIFSSVYSEGYGVYSVIDEQIKLLLKKNFSIKVVTLDSAYPKNSLYEIIQLKQDKTEIQNLLDRENPQIIITHTPPFYEIISNAKTNAIKIAYDHGEPFPSFFPINEEIARKKIDEEKKNSFQKFHEHISITQFIKRYSTIKSSKVIYNGFIPNSKQTNEHKNSNDTLNSSKSFTISCLSRIGVGENYYKHTESLIKIKKTISALVPQKKVSVTLIGRTCPPDNIIEQKLKAAGIDIFTNVDNETKFKLLKQSDIFISTSLWEGFNLPIVEAMSVGLPVISFSTGPHPEISPFHFTNFHELVNFVAKTIKDKSLLEFTKNTCEKHIKNKFTWQQNVNELINVIHSLRKKQNQGTLKTIAQQSISYISPDNKQYITHPGLRKNTYRTKYVIKGNPKISIIIPFKDKSEYLKKCLNSIISKSTYENYEILCINNNSIEDKTINLIKRFKSKPQIKFYDYKKPFNYSNINNFAVKLSKGTQLILLNNDIEIISPEWIEALLEHSQRESIGAVGGKLYYPDNTIQHAGVVVGICQAAGHIFRHMNKDKKSYMHRADTIQNVSAVTGACLMVKKRLYTKIGGLDGRNLPVAFNDIDFCLKLQSNGFYNIFTPYCEAYHHECVSRGQDNEPQNIARFKKEIEFLRKKYKKEIEQGDKYYNKNLSLNNENVIMQHE